MPPAAKNTDHGIGMPNSVLTQCGAFQATRKSPRGVRCPGKAVPVRTGPKTTRPPTCSQACRWARSTHARAAGRQATVGCHGARRLGAREMADRASVAPGATTLLVGRNDATPTPDAFTPTTTTPTTAPVTAAARRQVVTPTRTAGGVARLHPEVLPALGLGGEPLREAADGDEEEPAHDSRAARESGSEP